MLKHSKKIFFLIGVFFINTLFSMESNNDPDKKNSYKPLYRDTYSTEIDFHKSPRKLSDEEVAKQYDEELNKQKNNTPKKVVSMNEDPGFLGGLLNFLNPFKCCVTREKDKKSK